MDTFFVLLVIGVFAYGRAIRNGIVGAVVTLNATGQPVPATPANPNAVQGPVSGGTGFLPNSDGFALQSSHDAGPIFYETGQLNATGATSSGSSYHNPFATPQQPFGPPPQSKPVG